MADLKKLVLLCAVLMLVLSAASFAQQTISSTVSSSSVQNDVSPAVSDLPVIVGAPSDTANGDGDGMEGPSNPYPLLADPNGPTPPTANIQTGNLPAAQAAAGVNFAGLAAGAAFRKMARWGSRLSGIRRGLGTIVPR